MRATWQRKNGAQETAMAMAEVPVSTPLTWLQRYGNLHDATQVMLEASVVVTTDSEKGTRLNASMARLEGVASALEQDFIALTATASQAREKPVPHRLLRMLAEHEETACRR